MCAECGYRVGFLKTIQIVVHRRRVDLILRLYWSQPFYCSSSWRYFNFRTVYPMASAVYFN